MIAVLDTAIYQFADCSQRFVGNTVEFTAPSVIPLPDLTRATAHGVRGVLARATNASVIDPTYRSTVAAAVRDGVAIGAYAYLRPTFDTAAAHVDAFITAVRDAGVIGVAPMADCETMHPVPAVNAGIEAEWAGRRYADWLHAWLDGVEGELGRRPLIYTGAWWWNRMLAGCGAEFAGYDFVVSHYPHQPSTPGSVWPPVPPDATAWYQWARTTQGGDAGVDAPNLPAGATAWAGWQFTSALRAADFGFSSSGGLDGNIVTDEAWARWTARPASLRMPPTLRAGAQGHAVNILQNVLNVWSAGQGRATTPFTNAWNAGLEADLRWFQGFVGLGVDGVAGPKTWTALLRW
ncbi:MAG: GH25 family lysozyme [Ilumatobacteraceae bacterium]